jgi:uncharacterized protein YjbI with pentapeptide repeats
MIEPWQLLQRHNWNQWREQSSFEPITIERISFNGSDLSEYEFLNTTFIGCTFKRARLIETNFRSSILTDCDFTDAFFYKTMLEDVDLRTCIFNDWPVNCFTEGAIINTQQYSLLMEHFRKLRVLDS